MKLSSQEVMQRKIWHAVGDSVTISVVTTMTLTYIPFATIAVRSLQRKPFKLPR
jgi:hypothetical protein